MKKIAHVRRRFGYRRIHDLLRPQFPGVNHKRVYLGGITRSPPAGWSILGGRRGRKQPLLDIKLGVLGLSDHPRSQSLCRV
jgi:hypothetical protein